MEKLLENYPYGREHILILSTSKSPKLLLKNSIADKNIENLANIINATSLKKTSIFNVSELDYLRSTLTANKYVDDVPAFKTTQIISDIYAESHAILKHLKNHEKDIIYYIGFTNGKNSDPSLISKDKGLEELMNIFELESKDIDEIIYDKTFFRGFDKNGFILKNESDSFSNYLMLDMKIEGDSKLFLNDWDFMNYGIVDVILKSNTIPLQYEENRKFINLHSKAMDEQFSAGYKMLKTYEFKNDKGEPDGYTGLLILGHNRKISWHSYLDSGVLMLDIRMDKAFSTEKLSLELKNFFGAEKTDISYRGIKFPY